MFRDGVKTITYRVVCFEATHWNPPFCLFVLTGRTWNVKFMYWINGKEWTIKAVLAKFLFCFSRKMLTITVTAQRFPKELSCPLCKDAMKGAVYMRCCFSSFCDQCKFILLRLSHSVLVLLYTTHFFFQRNCEDCTNNFIIKINKDGTTWLNRRSSSSYICKLGL